MAKDEPRDTPARRAIFEQRERVRRVRSQCYRALNNDRSAPHAEMRAELMDYWDALSEFRDEVEETWEEHGLDEIPELAQERVEVSVEKPGYGAHAERTTKPKLATVDIWTLIDYSQGLDAAANKLGFAANTPNSIPNDEPDMADLRGLLQARGQDQALENLPEADD